MASENRLVPGTSVIVRRYSIIGTGVTVFEAYEPSSYMGGHHTLFTIDGQVHGSLPSRRLPAAIDAIPRGPERRAAVDSFRAANEAEAFAAIVAAFPEAAGGYVSGWSVEIWGEVTS